jgi:hypothetical protein
VIPPIPLDQPDCVPDLHVTLPLPLSHNNNYPAQIQSNPTYILLGH